MEVQLATAEYEAEQNTAASFRADCTHDVPAYLGGGAPVAVSVAQMRQEYVGLVPGNQDARSAQAGVQQGFQGAAGIQYDPNQIEGSC